MSWLPFELLLALRYLRPRRTFFSVITLISVVGVMLGVAVLIIVISVMSGFDKQLRDKILGFNAHLRVFQTGGPMQTYAKPISIISSNKEVRGVSPFVLGQVLVETQPDTEASVVGAPWLRGVDPALESKVSILPSSIISGTNSLRGASVWIGREFAEMMRLRVGDTLSIYSTRNLRKMRESRKAGSDEAVLPDEFKVTGIFDVGYYEYNASVIVASLPNAQDLYDLGDSVHGLFVTLHDPYQAPAVRRELEAALGPSYGIKTWSEENSSLLDALAVEKNVMFYLLFFIMIVAAFGITSALITFVVQKTREIGMLKALGATNVQIMWVFLAQSMTVGFLGASSGLALGVLAVRYRNEFLFMMRRVTGFELFPARIYNFGELPAILATGDVAIICGVSMLLCVLAGLLPAWTASRLKPVEALRHD